MGRRQRVVIDREFSNWSDVLSGILKGSVLDPLLFIMHLNYLVDSYEDLFADDTK